MPDPTMTTGLLRSWDLLERHLGGIAAGLSIGKPLALTPIDGTPHFGAELMGDGYATLPPPTGMETRCLRHAVQALQESGLPLALLYIFDQTWALAEALRATVSDQLNAAYEILADGWVWCVAPGSQGWPPHRGLSRLLDRTQPELLNAWVALTDVPRDRAPLCFVPFDSDPLYPDQLTSVAFSMGREHAAPVSEGSSLVFNANVLHWGGPCAQSTTPRMSCSFSLGRRDAREVHATPAIDLSQLSFEKRLSLVASFIITYGKPPEVASETIDWARAVSQLAGIGLDSATLRGRKER